MFCFEVPFSSKLIVVRIFPTLVLIIRIYFSSRPTLDPYFYLAYELNVYFCLDYLLRKISMAKFPESFEDYLALKY
jgi:hypothetical protein